MSKDDSIEVISDLESFDFIKRVNRIEFLTVEYHFLIKSKRGKIKVLDFPYLHTYVYFKNMWKITNQTHPIWILPTSPVISGGTTLDNVLSWEGLRDSVKDILLFNLDFFSRI